MSPDPVKVLHILDHSLPLHSGYSFRSHSILQAQRRRGLEPFALTSPKHEESWKGPPADREDISGIAYYRTGAVPPVGVHALREMRLVAALTRRILGLARETGPDLLHAHSPVLTAMAALRARRALRLPVVYEIRAFWEDAAVDHRTYGPRSWKYALVRALETRACRQADHIAVLCSGLREDLIRRGIPSAKITVIGNGIDPDAFGGRAPHSGHASRWGLDGTTVVGFIGSFYRYEGLDLLLEAVARLLPRRPSLRLLLVGGGEVESELRAEAARRGILDRVVFAGRLPQDEVASVYPMMQVLAYPRRSMRLTELVTPLKPLEAMASGVPLLASDIGGHRELIRDGSTGLLVPAGDPAALARGLERLLDDEPLRRRLASEGLAWVRAERTWDRTTEPYGSAYESARAAARARGGTR